MSQHGQATATAPESAETPRRLRMVFSQAADIGAVSKLFHPPLKREVDPAGYVLRRQRSVLRKALENGGVLIKDEKGEIQGMTLAYRHATGHVEIGSTLARRPGIARLMVAAMALKEYAAGQSAETITAVIHDENDKGRHLYQDTLKWEKIADENENRTLSAAAGKPPQQIDAGKYWYRCNDETIKAQASILQEFTENGSALINRDGSRTEIDLTALNTPALSRAIRAFSV